MRRDAIHTRLHVSERRRRRCFRSFRSRLLSLLCPDLGEEVGVPALGDVGVALHPVHERRLAQVVPAAFDEGEFHVVLSPAFAREDVLSQGADVVGHVHRFELRVVRHALEEGDGEAGPFAAGG